jgi:hypothetical protein
MSAAPDGCEVKYRECHHGSASWQMLNQHPALRIFNPMNFDSELAAWLAGVSARAYKAASVSDPATDTQVWMETLGKRTAIAFRGTDDFRKALDDIEIFLSMPSDLPANEGRWHSGVRRAVESVLPLIIAAAKKLPQDQKIYLTGHSFGGGCAAPAAYLLAQMGINIAGVITFAGMRFGDKFFEVNYNHLLGDRTFRVVAQYDVVPHLPLPTWLLPYRHVGTEVYLTEPAWEARLSFPSVEIGRSTAQMVLEDGLSIFKAWLVARGSIAALPRQVIQMHAIARYQTLISNINTLSKS